MEDHGVEADVRLRHIRAQLQATLARIASLSVTHPVNGDGVTAEFADGVLTITVPKLPVEAPRRVVVS